MAHVTGIVHIQDVGDRTFGNGEYAGTRGQSKRLEGFQVSVSGVPGLDIEYMAHVQDHGDTQWHHGGHFVGSRGQSKRVEGVAFRLTGPSAPYYKVKYTAHVENVGDVHGEDGAFIGSRGQSRRVEGIQVVIEPRWYEPHVTGVVHIQDVGDVALSGGHYAGTRGQSKRLEGLQVSVSGVPGLDIEYMGHVENVGDTQWHHGGHFLGSRGQSRRVEGVAFRLTGPAAPYYSVSYTAHVQDVGDVHGRDGEFIGSRGQSRRVEGIEVKVQRR